MHIAHSPVWNMNMGPEWLKISSRKDSDFDATRDERLEDGGAVDILYPHICIVSAYRVPPPSEGPLGFVPGFFTRGVGFFIQADWTAGGSWFVWSRVGDFSQPTNQPARPTSSQVRVTSTVWSTAIEGHSQLTVSVLWAEANNHDDLSWFLYNAFSYCLTAKDPFF